MTSVLINNSNGVPVAHESSMTYRLSTGREIRITAKLMWPQEAANLLLLNTRNRRQSSETISRIATAIAADQYFFTGDAIKIVMDENGIHVLGDGQHRLEAIVKAGKPVDVLLIENLDPKAMTFIDQDRNRRVGDILRMVYEHQGIKNDTIITGVAKILMAGYQGRFNATKPEIAVYADEHFELLQHWAAWARGVSDETGKVQLPANRGMSSAMTASPLGALAIYMVQQGADEDSVTDFFFRIANGLVSDSDTSNVIPAIRKRQSNGMPLVSGGSSGSLISLFSEFSVYIQAYNRWVSGEPVTLIKGVKRSIRSFKDLPAVTGASQ